MKHIYLLLFTLLAFTGAQAQIDSPDEIPTENGPLIVQPIVHGTVVLTWNNQTIYVDPYGGAEKFQGLNDPDLILITDIHGDHLNQKTLDALNTTEATFIVPQAVYNQLPDAMKEKASVLGNGENIMWENISVLAIPMYNLPESADSRHTKGRGNGYILTMGGKKVYFSGDTEDIPEMRGLTGIDVAFVCMNLPYTMDVDQAADAVSEFKPAIVYPYHYRGQGGLSDVASFKNKVNEATPVVDVRLKNWYMN